MSVLELDIENESWFKIENSQSLRPFLMSVVSNSNHWMFISSNGGLSAGRKNSEYALFPYYTDDKLTELAHTTGSKTIFQVETEKDVAIWEPFAGNLPFNFDITQNLYKNRIGNKVMFEEINHDLDLTFRYQWNSSDVFGFVKRSELINNGERSRKITLLDGIQNIMPYGVNSDLQQASSNLVDAYKRSELVPETGLGIFALSAIIVDRAEPSEALKANIAWSAGLDDPEYLMSSQQLDAFRKGNKIEQETDVKAEKGGYFMHKTVDLKSNSDLKWYTVAEVNKNHSQVVKLNERLKDTDAIISEVEADVEAGSENLKELVASADGIQVTNDPLKDARHFSNTMFNIMRGGIFDNNYEIGKEDFSKYLKNASKDVYGQNTDFLNALPESFTKFELDSKIEDSEDADLVRLCKEYLPLKFSRRHGDPSRPWNKFSINLYDELDGSKILDYEGNWRDIFQNWEALAHSYPYFVEGMIHKFLNATTFDGYNPYRVTKGGFDWETIEPDDPWSYIGYWGDHQIIYLLKFLEFYKERQPEAFKDLFDKDLFVYANVPYRIKSYEDIARDPKDTIVFDDESDHKIREQVAKTGADGALLTTGNGDLYHVNFIEKILATALAKVSNFIPEGGIWMNTQRPEWNDANNALVGNGVSMVTLYYLRRFFKFFEPVLENLSADEITISAELKELFDNIHSVLKQHEQVLDGNVTDEDRKKITEGLGQAGSDYRTRIYNEGFSGVKTALPVEQLRTFTDKVLGYLEHSIEANKREDGLYHAYNLMSMKEDGISISYLDEMLEGQVAVLSSKYLDSEEAASVLNALRKSSLYREDQESYILYPNKSLPGFLEKNNIPESLIKRSELLQRLVADNNLKIVSRDVNGDYHFNGNFKNAGDLKKALHELKNTQYQELADQEESLILSIFEEVFNHKAFTGRSGTFFGYEGLGSIYWHMVSKLYLAAYEVCETAYKTNTKDEVKEELFSQFDEIGEGIGIHKAPELYGAFPTDAYSHTPQGRGAQQPGMTGQVKEDILVRFGELGISVKEGALNFEPFLLKKDEFLTQETKAEIISLDRDRLEQSLTEGSLCFTCCQTPVEYEVADSDKVIVHRADGSAEEFNGLHVNAEATEHVFKRTGKIQKIIVSLSNQHLK